MSDPCAISLNFEGTTWHYISGSSFPNFSNFSIYRTKDFKVFELHMTAFGDGDCCPSGPSSASTQCKCGGTLWLGNDFFTQLHGPNFYIEMEEVSDTEPRLRLVFTAVKNHVGFIGERQEYHSTYQTSITVSDFLSWHDPNRLQPNGPVRFSHPVTEFGYKRPEDRPTGQVYHDGGYSRQNPVTGETKWLGCTVSSFDTGNQCGQIVKWLWGRYHRCLNNPTGRSDLADGMTVMWLDPYVLIDEGVPVNAAWRRSILYNWNRNDQTISYAEWGSSIAAAALEANCELVRSDVNVLPLAYLRNQYNALQGPIRNFFGQAYQQTSSFDNGAGDIVWGNFNVSFGTSFPAATLVETPFAAGLEGASAFRRLEPSQPNRIFGDLYMIGSRNFWTSPAYQLVYRKIITPNDSPTGLALGRLQNWKDRQVQESLLLRSARYLQANGRSFGHSDTFRFFDRWSGQNVYMLVFHVKVDNNVTPDGQILDKRTVWFKELTFDTDGNIATLQDGGNNPQINCQVFRVPAQGRCCAVDRNSDGTINSDDIFAFLDLFFANRMGANCNNDGRVSSDDVFCYLDLWFSCIQ